MKIKKTFLDETVYFNWQLKFPDKATPNQVLKDTLDRFKDFGNPLIDRSYIGEIFVLYNCNNCSHIENPTCSDPIIDLAPIFDLCIAIYEESRVLEGEWVNRGAEDRAEVWVDKHRKRIEF